jgi:hypothetical protein
LAILISGTIPSVLRENSGASDWTGALRVRSSRGAITDLEAVGAGALHVSLLWDSATETLVVQPGAAVDFEAFAAAGTAPELVFALRARLANGRWDADSPVLRVTVLDEDDTPPTALRFASGGTVAAGAIGVVIGTLAVSDPDSVGPFAITLPAEEWRFELVDGATLKLRDGISLGLDDRPVLPLFVTVSDGRQSAGFVLEIAVRDADAPGSPSPVLAVGESQGAVALPAADRALILREASAVIQLAAAEGEPLRLDLRGGAAAWLPPTAVRLDFEDGRLELGDGGLGSRLAAMLRVAQGDRADEGVALAQWMAAAEAGLALAELAGREMPDRARLEDAAFVSLLFAQAGLAAPSDTMRDALLARLGSGVSRGQLALDIAAEMGAASTGSAPGVWIPISFGATGVQAGSNGTPPDTMSHSEAAPPPPFLDLIIG